VWIVLEYIVFIINCIDCNTLYPNWLPTSVCLSEVSGLNGRRQLSLGRGPPVQAQVLYPYPSGGGGLRPRAAHQPDHDQQQPHTHFKYKISLPQDNLSNKDLPAWFYIIPIEWTQTAGQIFWILKWQTITAQGTMCPCSQNFTVLAVKS
jgi:hypothetical protein